jgi:ribosomal protein L3 glutamine methyltransferase
MNIKIKKLDNKITASQGDLYNALINKKERMKYNLIMSNPPYVDINGMNNLPKEFSYEPSIALNGGRDGLGMSLTYAFDSSAFLCRIRFCDILTVFF